MHTDKEKQICHFYIQFRCKHGRSGKGCDFEHPKICLSLMNKGTKGCSKAEDCDFVHPKMCQKSLNGKKCENKRCFLGHVLGTRDIKISTNTEETSKKDKKDKDFRPTKPKGHKPNSQNKEIKDKKELTSSQDTPVPSQKCLSNPSCSSNQSIGGADTFAENTNRTVSPHAKVKPGRTAKFVEGSFHKSATRTDICGSTEPVFEPDSEPSAVLPATCAHLIQGEKRFEETHGDSIMISSKNITSKNNKNYIYIYIYILKTPKKCPKLNFHFSQHSRISSWSQKRQINFY